MSGEINVLSRSQIIVVEPASQSVAVINAGPIAGNPEEVLKAILTDKGDLLTLNDAGEIVHIPAPLDTQLLIGDTASDVGMQWMYNGLPKTTWKVIWTNRTSTTTLADDPDLKTDTIPANKKVRFRGFIWWSTPTAADFKFALTGPAGAYGVIVRHGAGPGGTPAFGAFGTAFPVSGSYTEVSGTQFGAMIIEGVMQNQSNAGPITLQWAQNTSDVGNTSVNQGSWLDWLVLPL